MQILCDQCIHQHVCLIFRKLQGVLNEKNGFDKSIGEMAKIIITYCMDFEKFPVKDGSEQN